VRRRGDAELDCPVKVAARPAPVDPAGTVDGVPAHPRPWPAVGLAIWTLFVWLTRVRNALGDGDLGVADRTFSLVLATSFLVLAGLVLQAVIGRRGHLGRAVLVLAGWTTVVWIVRGVGIATGDHSIAFVVVHLLLAAISIGLSAVAVRSVATLRDGFSVTARRG
jgi:hypothetical protein